MAVALQLLPVIAPNIVGVGILTLSTEYCLGDLYLA